MEEKNEAREDKIIEIIKRQNIHLARISKNVQFFFWFFIVSLSLSILSLIYTIG